MLAHLSARLRSRPCAALKSPLDRDVGVGPAGRHPRGGGAGRMSGSVTSEAYFGE